MIWASSEANVNGTMIMTLSFGTSMSLPAARGALAIFLPAYSPDLNPIEQLFARLKSFLRKMKARTVEELWRAIASFLKEVSKDECKAYLANSGYA